MGPGTAYDGPTTGILSESNNPGIFDVQPYDEQTGDTGDSMVSAAPSKPPARRLPCVWGDVPPRNPNFTGREELLSRLHKELLTAREATVLPQALHGMGGVGKSQLAIEYVHRHSNEYDLVWWISAEQNSLVLSSLVKLAQRLGLDVNPEANSAVPAVQDALNAGKTEYERWLLVFDNAESIEEVRPYFPTGGGGRIVVTSRNPEWASVARALEVDVFTREESKAFLTDRAPKLSDGDANRLAEALGDLPLAIEQAASWRAATGMPVDKYLSLLNEKRIDLLDDTSSSGSQKAVKMAEKPKPRLPRIPPADFRPYEALETALEHVTSLFRREEKTLDPYSFRVLVRSQGNALDVRIYRHGKLICLLRLEFTDAFADDRLVTRIRWTEAGIDSFTGYVIAKWDSNVNEPCLQSIDFAPPLAPLTPIAADDLFDLLWEKIVDQLDEIP